MNRLKRWWLQLKSELSPNYLASVSMQPTKRMGLVTIFGEEYFLTMPDPILYTLEEYARMSIACVYCGHAIQLGDPVTTYVVEPPEQVPFGTVVSVKSRLALGCIRASCQGLPYDHVGYWKIDEDHTGQGKLVYQFP